MKPEVAKGAASLAGAGVTGIIGYFIAMTSAGDNGPNWPYLALAALVVISLGVYFVGRQSWRPASSGEMIIYDSDKSRLLGHDFSGEEAQLHTNGGYYGDKGRGKLSFVESRDKIISICRTNNSGRYKLTLRRYSCQGRGGSSSVLPANVAISGRRHLTVSFEAKVTGRPHELIFGLKPTSPGKWLAEGQAMITRDSWESFTENFEINPARDCYFRIDDHYPSGPASGTLQIRRIVVAERAADS